MLEEFLTHRVDLSRDTDLGPGSPSRDAEGGRIEHFVPYAIGLSCLKQPKTVSRLNNQGQIESVTGHRVYFGSGNPAIEVGDLLDVTDEVGDLTHLIALGNMQDQAGQGESYVVDASERA